MILQALSDLARQENLVGDSDYEWRPIAWRVRIDRTGKLLGIESTHYVPESPATSQRVAKPVATSYLVPREESRTSGDYAFFLFDKAEYVFGVDPTGQRQGVKLNARSLLFRQRVEECAQATSDEGALAVSQFLEDVAAGRQHVELPEDCTPNDLFAFVYAPDVDILVTSREKVRSYWKNTRVGDGADKAKLDVCLVSGRPCVPVKKHPPIKRVPGGTTSGVSLVSFNSSAFESYGWDRNENAVVSREAAETCATALNRLLDPAPRNFEGQPLAKRNLRLSADTVVCFWTPSEGSEEFVDCFAPLLEANPEQVAELYRSIWRGKAPKMDDPSAFYALTLSGAQGRAIVRDWFEATVPEVAEQLARHFADLDIVRNTPKPKKRDLPPQLPLRVLLRSLAPQRKDDAIAPPMVAQLIAAALRGIEYPLSILQRAVQRTRAEIGHTDWADFEARDARAALIKGVLNRRKRFRPDTTAYKEITRAMDPNNEEPGYLLGRLLAVIERMQQIALGDINASVVDRFFSGASATPGAVFPRLMKNLRHHARKAKDSEQSSGTAGWLEGQVDRIVAKIEPALGGFPPHLDLQQQGLFIVGYHHMRHWLWMTKEARQAWQAEHAEANASA